MTGMIQKFDKRVGDHHSSVTQITLSYLQVLNLPRSSLSRVQLKSEHRACDHCVDRRRSVPCILYMGCFGGFRII